MTTTYSLSLHHRRSQEIDDSSNTTSSSSSSTTTNKNIHNLHSHGHAPPPHRRFSLSTPDELRSPSFPSQSTFASTCSLSDEEIYPPVSPHDIFLLQQQQQHHNTVSAASSSPSSGGLLLPPPAPLSSTRVERLLRQRELNRARAFFLRSKFNDPRGEDKLRQVHVQAPEADAGNGHRQRLLVVANRLPVSATKKGHVWSLELSAGGLVSALLGVRQFETRWIGWAGVNVTDEEDQIALTKAFEGQRCVPVFLDEETVHQYYNGYCNNVLWPLFHYLGLPQEDRLSATRSLEDQLEAYRRANKKFADVVYKIYKEGDIIWCHDYHLMFLPKCLKELDNKMKVGWFLHTPFPSSEIYRTLPSRSELLKAVLCADLIGFHTYDYARHFVSACTRILGVEGTPSGVEDHPLGKFTRVAAFPIGIDPQRFFNALKTPEVKRYIQELQDKFAGRKVMLGVDRLDMIKGIPQKLLAFEKFLDENANWRDKVQLVQIAVPTRTDVHDYQRLTSQVHEIVGRINGRFGTLTTVPIHHLDRSLDFHKLCALYAITDVALVTSLRDGMNLVSYEFVACQNMKKGVLILSELAGAAQSLGAGAILVNPWNISDVAAAIKEALDMTQEEREECHRHNFDHVSSHTAQSWADTFVNELNDTILEAQLRILRVPPHLPVREAVKKYHQANNRLLILGFNLTLTVQTEGLGRRAPDHVKLRLHPQLEDVLGILCNDPKTTIVILSGSERSALDEVFRSFDLWLAAENGMFLRHTEGDWKTTMPEHLNMDWIESVQPVFEYFLERTPRSYLETRDTSLVWNYKFADVEFGRVQARDMLQHLWTGPISNAAVDVVQGAKSVEVRPVGVSKGAAIDRILGEIAHKKRITTPIDYVLCVGHFLSKDEDIYTFFEPELPVLFEKEMNCSSSKVMDGRPSTDRKAGQKVGERVSSKSTNKTSGSANKVSNSNVKASGRSKGMLSISNDNQAARNNNKKERSMEDELGRHEGSSVLDLRGDNYFSCAVARKRSNARYSLATSEDVVSFLKEIADNYSS